MVLMVVIPQTAKRTQITQTGLYLFLGLPVHARLSVNLVPSWDPWLCVVVLVAVQVIVDVNLNSMLWNPNSILLIASSH